MATLTDRILVVIDASSKGATQELDKLQRETKKSGDAFDTLGKQIGLAGSTIKAGLVAGATALVGTGLVTFLNDSVRAFQESNQAASQFARATNASVEEAGKFTQVMAAYGLEMNDLIEINAEFSKKIQQQPQLLEKLNVQVSKNADGSVNMTKTLVSTIDALGAMEDGLQANQIAAQLFGEEGSKQLAAFYNAGIQVSDMMDRINFIDQSEQASKFAASSAELDLAFQQLQITIGAQLVPALTGLIDAGLAVFEFFSTLPGPVVDLGIAVGITAAAFVAWNVVMKSTMTQAFLSETALLITGLATAIAQAGGVAAASSAGFAVLRAGLASLAATAGPLLAVVAAITLLQGIMAMGDKAKAFTRDTDNMGKSLKKMGEEARDSDSVVESLVTGFWAIITPATQADLKMQQMSKSLEEQARATLESADATQAQKDAAQNLLEVQGEGSRMTKTARLNTEEGTKAINDYNVAMNGAAGMMDNAAQSSRDLADMLANGAYTQEELSAAVREGAENQHDANMVTDTAKGLMEAYADATWDAVDATNSMFDAQHRLRSAQDDVTEAVKEYNDLVASGSSTEQQRIEAMDKVAAAMWDIGDASVAAYVAEEQRYGRYPDQMQQDAVRLQAMQDNLNAISGTPAGAQAAEEFSLAVAAWARANPTNYPVGWDIEDIDAAIANIQGQIDSTEDPKVKADLQTDLDALNTLKTNIQTGAATTVDVKAVATGTNEVKNELDSAAGDRTSNVTINVTNNAGAKSTIDAVAQDRTSDVEIDVTNDRGAQSILDNVAKEREAPISIDLVNDRGAKSILDGLVAKRIAPIEIDITNNEGAKWTLDQVAKKRTAIIEIDVRGESAARAAIAGISRPSPSLAAFNRVVLPEIALPQPVNIVKVNVDGQQLRATIRDELLRVRESDDLVAAMGTVA